MSEGVHPVLIAVYVAMGVSLLFQIIFIYKDPTIGNSVAIIAAIVLGFALFGTSFFFASKFIGSNDSWVEIQKYVPNIWGLTAGGSIAIFSGALLYYIEDPKQSTYFILALTCASFGLSYGAFAIAAISR